MVGKGKEIAVVQSIDKPSVECHKYYLARRTTMEMLRDRGYDVSDEDVNFSLEQFRALYGERPDVDRLRISAKHRFDSSKKITVVFCGTGMVKVNAMRVIAADVLNRESITGLILVLQSHITNQALKAVELFSFKVELFEITDLLVNVTKHVLRPKHQVLNDKEKESLLKKFSIEEKQLPRLSSKDPIVRYYGLETGQVMKVTYKDELSESHVTYRCVM
ncbi:RNA polymerase Rpb5 N-terminal domain superfamily [Arabidopsis thaliana x Arabidopsis arenosa]|uniref:RNA polymerase Rpb5 N-terminal domain superfamily n=1 Tax=Arabidopsis thaliana x Arabidopsis arenosa TaxID=1240361 RepID=A0A8T2ABD3_9BRAS|nr:RNA polymerase Rpb5 N-terminal domain superfamily [Arabidopsis thaliana x Arabidopsis arenosa]